MAAANTDKVRKHKSLFSTTLSGDIAAGATTAGLSSTSGLATDTAITLTIDRVDANGVSTPTAMERVTGVVSGSNLGSLLRGEDGGSGKAHSSGAVVEDIWDAETWNDFCDAFLVDHSQAGAHAMDTLSEKTAAAGVTVDSVLLKDGGITLAAAGILKLGASFPGITDANANELLKFTQTASAVNELTLANAATGTNPVISMTGGDANVGLDMKMKAAGYFRKPTLVELLVIATGTDCATGDGKFLLTIPEELNGMNLTAVHAAVYTAGTTNTMDIQLRNVTDSVDMLSTKLTIDSTEVGSDTAATPAVIDTTKDDVATNDRIAVDIDAVHTTAAKGLVLRLRFELP